MARPVLRLPALSSTCFQCRQELFPRGRQILATPLHLLNTASRSYADVPVSTPSPSPSSGLSSLSRSDSFNSRAASDIFSSLSGASSRNANTSLSSYRPPPKPHHLHIYATRHNCHITLTAGNRDAIISVSSGNLNFRKSARGSYDAAFQLGAFVMAKIKNLGLLNDQYTGKGGPIRALELVLRDFGPGREAVTKILMGQEGRELRQRVTRVMDGTRLKFGGTRSPKPRRLG